MVDRLGPEGFHEAEFIDDFRGLGEQRADPGTGFAVLGELELGAGEWQDGLFSRHAGEALAAAHVIWESLAVEFVELWFVVEKILLSWPAGHEEIDDALRLGGVVGEQVFALRGGCA